MPSGSPRRFLTIASDAPAVLNLPWVEGVLTRKKSLRIWLGWPRLLHTLPGHRESAFGIRAAVGRPQRRAGLGTGQQADEGY